MRARAIVAEDEPLLRENLVELLGAAWPELEIVAVAADGLQALRAVNEHRPDVLFLDIEMPEASGLEVARRASGCHVVFVTGYDRYAVAAFEQGAVDYVMKPLSGVRIAAVVKRVKERLRWPPASLAALVDQLANAPSSGGRYLRWINASRGEDVQLITTDEVRYFQSDTKYTRVVAAHAEGLIRKSIKELVDELDPLMFWQIHRAAIVNVHAIERVTRGLRDGVLLAIRDRPELLSVSQPYAHLFRKM